MSAHFLVRYRGQPVRFTYRAGQRLWEIVPRSLATPFIAEADAWHAACQHQLSPQFVEVTAASETGKAVAT